MKVFGIEGRYAHALYSAASKSKQLEKVEGELIKIEVHIFCFDFYFDVFM